MINIHFPAIKIKYLIEVTRLSFAKKHKTRLIVHMKRKELQGLLII